MPGEHRGEDARRGWRAWPRTPSVGSSGNAWTTSDATNQPVKAAGSIMPSMPMLTTPERSFMNAAERAEGDGRRERQDDARR